jgi:uracil-DNA glycosylase
MKEIIEQVKTCALCAENLQLGPKPVLSVHPLSKILIIGQAPGIKVHSTGIPWNDKSGEQLRRWLGVSHETFYNVRDFAIMPMGFCYPGKGPGGDLPPSPVCAPHWHERILVQLKRIELTILVGLYAQKYYLGKNMYNTLTETVRNYKDYLPSYFPIVHPSPRNGIWMRRNPWFETAVVPQLQRHVKQVLAG